MLEDTYNDMVTEVWDVYNDLNRNLERVSLASTKCNLITVKGLQKEKNRLMGKLTGIQKAFQNRRGCKGLVMFEKDIQ